MNVGCAPWILVLSSVAVYSVPVDNGVEGDPDVECGDTFIGIRFQTRNPFQGRIFVKDHFGDPECRVGATNTSRAGMELAFTSCGVQRTRSTIPRGVFVGVTVIISFHSQFITKVDKAYMIQCYYMESWKRVTAELEVSMLTTAFQSETVSMPVCRYEVLSGGPDGPPVRFAQVGDQVYHKWTCDTETVDTFCMTVHSCQVDDGAGDQITLLDEIGCGLDRHILGNLEYINDLMVGKEAHVFKYADRPDLYFDCQITITIKVPGLPCPRPGCAELHRGKRSPTTNSEKDDIKVDSSLTTLETTSTPQTKLLVQAGNSAVRDNWANLLIGNETAQHESEYVCMSLAGMSAFTALTTFLVLSSLVLCGASLKHL